MFCLQSCDDVAVPAPLAYRTRGPLAAEILLGYHKQPASESVVKERRTRAAKNTINLS